MINPSRLREAALPAPQINVFLGSWFIGAVRQDANKAAQSKRDFSSRQVKLEIKCYSYKGEKNPAFFPPSFRTMGRKKCVTKVIFCSQQNKSGLIIYRLIPSLGKQDWIFMFFPQKEKPKVGRRGVCAWEDIKKQLFPLFLSTAPSRGGFGERFNPVSISHRFTTHRFTTIC